MLVVQIGKGLWFWVNGTNQTNDSIRGAGINPHLRGFLGGFLKDRYSPLALASSHLPWALPFCSRVFTFTFASVSFVITVTSGPCVCAFAEGLLRLHICFWPLCLHISFGSCVSTFVVGSLVCTFRFGTCIFTFAFGSWVSCVFIFAFGSCPWFLCAFTCACGSYRWPTMFDTYLICIWYVVDMYVYMCLICIYVHIDTFACGSYCCLQVWFLSVSGSWSSCAFTFAFYFCLWALTFGLSVFTVAFGYCIFTSGSCLRLFCLQICSWLLCLQIRLWLFCLNICLWLLCRHICPWLSPLPLFLRICLRFWFDLHIYLWFVYLHRDICLLLFFSDKSTHIFSDHFYTHLQIHTHLQVHTHLFLALFQRRICDMSFRLRVEFFWKTDNRYPKDIRFTWQTLCIHSPLGHLHTTTARWLSTLTTGAIQTKSIRGGDEVNRRGGTDSDMEIVWE